MRLIVARTLGPLLLALFAVLIPTLVTAAPTRLPENPTRENVLGWINTYRHNPDPDRVPAAYRSISRLGLLSDPEGSGVYVGFLAGVIASNPAKAEALIAKMLPIAEEHQWAIVRAIAYSGRPEWKTMLRRLSAKLPQRRVMIDRFLDGKLPTLEQAPIEKDETWRDRARGYITVTKYFKKAEKETTLALTPDLLDALWGYYYATGHMRPLSRIVLMLRWTKERDVIEKLTLGAMAKYTLAINSARNPDLLANLKWAAGQPQPDGVKGVLTEVIEAAETFETAKLRADALASIEELKRKGPGSRRDISLWGQVGEGALALGCIAAAVAGQVEFGIPCVVGGAATSAALRIFGSQN
jgi:hypothetical protein